MNELQRIVEFWRTVELLSPREVRPASPTNNRFDLHVGAPLPWDEQHVLRRRRIRSSTRWRYVVYCGVFRLEDAFDVLERRFPSVRHAYDRRPLGDGALAAFVVNEDGRPLFGSQTLSSCAWAVGRLVADSGPHHGLLQQFDEAQRDFELRFEELLSAADEVAALREADVEVGRVVDAEQLTRLLTATTTLLSVDDVFAANGYRVEAQQVPVRDATAVEHDFLNSFVAEDLRQVVGALAGGDCGAVLARYLKRTVDEDARVDVDTDLDAVRAEVAPWNVPPGRWPAAPEQSLSLSQQFAVNAALRDLRDASGNFAVNGPPGTGKTTMLRDLIAALVVERADQLAELRQPTDAFVDHVSWRSSGYARRTHLIDERLTGYEIVVACATNAAAENITVELPGLEAIDPPWREDADYFADVATAILDDRKHDPADETPPAWGLVAACLGNARNRHRFANSFWLAKEPIRAANAPSTFRAVLESGQSAEDATSWRDAVADYQAAKAVEQKLAERRHAAWKRLEALPRRREESAQLHAAAATATEERAAAETAHSEQVRRVADAAEARDRRMQVRRDHAAVRPGVLETIFTFGRSVRRWRAIDDDLAELAAEATSRFEGCSRRESELRAAAEAATAAATGRAEASDAARAELRALELVVADDRDAWGVAYPDEAWWSDVARRETRPPWVDEEWNRARTSVFLAALRLHRAFIYAARKQLSANLQGTIDILKGSAPRDLDETIARASWQTLFLIVPVVSTTFASVARLFAHLSSESLGWLFIDEAGQATPQQAVGALWRSTRAVFVGDPLQLEPVTTLPFTVEEAVRESSGVDRLWSTWNSSVQRLADRHMTFGAHRGSGGSALWVGAPLNVHRRCDEPMFSISNQLAYDGRMVHGTQPRQDLPAPRSQWFDVLDGSASGNWIPAEGQRLRALLDELQSAGVAASEIFVISPFRDVERHLRDFQRAFPGLMAGTIHKTQGREADVVVLVLGGAPNRPGAKAWAAERPNLLNVAASRARRRLYVIGNRDAWGDLPHFQTLAAALRVMDEDFTSRA